MNTEQNTNIPQQAEKVVSWLTSIADNRGIMAELRHLLRPSLRQRGWMAISSIGGIGDTTKETIAGLFALYPYCKETNIGSLGESCRLLRWTLNKKKKDGAGDSSPLDIRFRRILSADRGELREVLTKLIPYLKSHDIPVNYTNLYIDMSYWGEKVKQLWAQDYWASQEKEAEDVSE